MLKLKRIYEKTEKSDGFRILVDRLWPRGVSKEKAKLNLWLKDIAPTTELRKWFSHDPDKWRDFQKKYKSEIMANREVFSQLKEIIKKRKKSLFFTRLKMRSITKLWLLEIYWKWTEYLNEKRWGHFSLLLQS